MSDSMNSTCGANYCILAKEAIRETLTSNKLGSEGLGASSSHACWVLPCRLNASTSKPYMCTSTVLATKAPVGW